MIFKILVIPTTVLLWCSGNVNSYKTNSDVYEDGKLHLNVNNKDHMVLNTIFSYIYVRSLEFYNNFNRKTIKVNHTSKV